MRIYWIKAQAPRRVLALVKHLGIAAECIEMDLMAGYLAEPAYARSPAKGSRLAISSLPPWRPTGDRRRCHLSPSPNVVRWIERLEAIPAWADPWPSDKDP